MRLTAKRYKWFRVGILLMLVPACATFLLLMQDTVAWRWMRRTFSPSTYEVVSPDNTTIPFDEAGKEIWTTSRVFHTSIVIAGAMTPVQGSSIRARELGSKRVVCVYSLSGGLGSDGLPLQPYKFIVVLGELYKTGAGNVYPAKVGTGEVVLQGVAAQEFMDKGLSKDDLATLLKGLK